MLRIGRNVLSAFLIVRLESQSFLAPYFWPSQSVAQPPQTGNILRRWKFAPYITILLSGARLSRFPILLELGGPSVLTLTSTADRCVNKLKQNNCWGGALVGDTTGSCSEPEPDMYASATGCVIRWKSSYNGSAPAKVIFSARSATDPVISGCSDA